MFVVFRTDASVNIGTGHITRCLTLSSYLSCPDTKILFISRQLPDNFKSIIKKKGYDSVELSVEDISPGRSAQKSHHLNSSNTDWRIDANKTKECLAGRIDADWLVVDHYGIDQQWESEVQPFVKRIMVIDDLANRKHDCDMLLDQNLTRNGHRRYDHLVPEKSIKLLGPRYALLRPEFMRARHLVGCREGNTIRIMVFFGGSDPANETEKAIKAICNAGNRSVVTDVIVGSSNPHRKSIERLCSSLPNFNYHCQINNIAEFMLKADLAIGAGGTTTWERCFLGLPTIILVVAENQMEIAEATDEAGAAWNLGWSKDVSTEKLAGKIRSLYQNPAELKAMSIKAIELMGKESFRGGEYIAQIMSKNENN